MSFCTTSAGWLVQLSCMSHTKSLESVSILSNKHPV